MAHEHRSSAEERLGPRDRLVLNTVVELYIASGEPVASHALARRFENKEGLSPATLRNVLASLAEAGWLDQPHASAGRIPTARAFRFYVEQLLQRPAGAVLDPVGPGGPAGGLGPLSPLNPMSGDRLSEDRRGQIEDGFAGVHSTQQFLERTSHMLAMISSGVGVALSGRVESQALDHIHFTRLAPGRVLAVLVSRSGMLQDRVLVLDRDLEYAELEAAARFLNENFRGWAIDGIRAELMRRLEAERSAYDRLAGSLEELCRKGALAPAEAAPVLYVEGVANLIASEPDRDRLRQMLIALEARQQLIALLNAYVDARQQHVRVVVGLEDALPEMRDLVLVAAPVNLGTAGAGTVAVIAPTRMPYQETIGAVSYIARISDRILQASQP